MLEQHYCKLRIAAEGKEYPTRISRLVVGTVTSRTTWLPKLSCSRFGRIYLIPPTHAVGAWSREDVGHPGAVRSRGLRQILDKYSKKLVSGFGGTASRMTRSAGSISRSAKGGRVSIGGKHGMTNSQVSQVQGAFSHVYANQVSRQTSNSCSIRLVSIGLRTAAL